MVSLSHLAQSAPAGVLTVCAQKLPSRSPSGKSRVTHNTQVHSAYHWQLPAAPLCFRIQPGSGKMMSELEMEAFWDWFQPVQGRVLGSLAIALALLLLRLLVMAILNRRVEDVRQRYQWRKTVSYLAFVLGLALITPLWLKEIQSLATYLGLLSAGVAVALAEPLRNVAGWAFILWQRPFQVGDRVQIGSQSGDVIDQRLFHFSMLEIGNWVGADQSTGRVIHVPNGKVFGESLTNFSQGFDYIWHEVPVLITFESNWEKAKELLQEIADRHAAHLQQPAEESVQQSARHTMIMYANLTPTVYIKVQASGVQLALRLLCEVRQRRSTEQAIWEDILRAFAQHADIEFAYPTQRFYNRQVEQDGRP